MLACRQDSEGRHLGIMLRQDGWKYAILGLIDVEANYLVVKAYTYTTITSIQVTQEVVAGCSKDFAAIFLSTVLSPNGSWLKVDIFYIPSDRIVLCTLSGALSSFLDCAKPDSLGQKSTGGGWAGRWGCWQERDGWGWGAGLKDLGTMVGNSSSPSTGEGIRVAWTWHWEGWHSSCREFFVCGVTPDTEVVWRVLWSSGRTVTELLGC